MTPADVEYQAEAYRALRDRGGVSFAEWVRTKGFTAASAAIIRSEVKRQDREKRDGVPF